MRKLLAQSALGLAAAGLALGAVAPAEAQRWHGGGYRGGWHGGYGGYRGHYGGGGAAVAAGILGLGVGAAIASDRGYYGRPYGGYYGYGYGPAYYGPAPGYYGGYCRSDWRWDDWAGHYVRVRYCD